MNRRIAALVAVLVGVGLMTVPALAQFQTPDGDPVRFQVWTDEPPSEDASWDSPTTVNASAIPDSVVAEIREAGAGDDGESVRTRTAVIDETLYPALESSPEAVYVRDGSTWYRLNRSWGTGGFVDASLVLGGVSFVAGLVITALGGWYGVFGGE
ncbi:hypothetical protein I7X12_13755 [Halosimplex litoreum]|uniref:Uncharacterized protein n=1 Tax=Halosimplex litoreum TaxID=1198301 RepID=A0A7T3FW89_9EURY|nr:hypothetical protein [Halosimplex litoreum]QPV61811.1 hypothetical protein I7X12_13755 [Halosimplex litoreum]